MKENPPPTPPEDDPSEDTGWFDRPENVRKILIGLFSACAFFVVIDIGFWLTGFDKHPYFRWEQWPGFYAVYGFVACVLLVLIAKYLLRPLVMRGENYYDDDDSEVKNDTRSSDA